LQIAAGPCFFRSRYFEEIAGVLGVAEARGGNLADKVDRKVRALPQREGAGRGAPRCEASAAAPLQQGDAAGRKDVLSWSDMYEGSPIDVKKMIVSQLVRAVHVSRDYKLEIDFKISTRQLGLEQEQEAVHEPKQKKRRDDLAL